MSDALLKSLSTMPKISRDEWQQLAWPVRWLVMSRASVLVMTFCSCAIGGLLAYRDGAFDLTLFLLCMAGLLLAHATNNQLNDLTDSVRGIDKDNYFRNRYGTHVLEDGLMARRELIRWIVATGALAVAAGLALAWARSGATLQLLAAGMFFVLFYTWPLKYFGLGEPAVLLVWGPLMVGGTYYVVSGSWSWPVALLSLVYALGPTAVLFGKHTDKLEADRAKKVYSLPVILGERNARWAVISMLIAQYMLVLIAVLFVGYGWPLLLVFISLPALVRLIRAYLAPSPSTCPADFPAEIWPLWFSAFAFDHTRKFSMLFLLGLAISILLPSAFH